MKPLSRFVSLTLLYWLTTLVAQAQYFNNRYANPGSPYQSSLTSIVSTDSGYVSIGQSSNYPASPTNSLVLRWLNPDGRQRRARYFGQTGDYYASNFRTSLLTLPDGGYASSATRNAATGDNYPMLWRFTAAGDTLWTKTYGPQINRIFYNGCYLPGRGYALVGTAQMAINPYDGDVLLIRTDTAGNKLWEHTYHAAFSDDATTVAATPDGGFLLGGSVRYTGGFSNYDALVLKVDSLGREQWRRVFGGPYYDGNAHVTVLADGTYLVGMGLTVGVVNGYVQMRTALYKLNPLDGSTRSQRLYGPPLYGTQVFALHELADGSLVTAGGMGDTTNARPLGNGFPVGYILKVCADGDSVWYRTYRQLTGGFSENYPRDLRPTPDGGFVGCGFLIPHAPDTGSADGWAFKLDSAGYLQAGGTPPTRVCPRPQVGLPPDEAAAPPVAVWPNPAPDGRFTLQAPGATTYTVADALGREVAHGAVRAGENALDLSRHPSGLYLLRLTSRQGRTTTYKLLR